ncbi:MAG: hemerythrin domain-containing protein [Phycisphaerae bacterium]
MSATEALRQEHQVILKMLDRFEAALSNARKTCSVTAAAFAPFLDFFRGFADRCHHGKEEDRLFPCLNRCGLPSESGPIAVMLEEHRIGRQHVRTMRETLDAAKAGQGDAIKAFLAHGDAFLELLRGHIGKEDNVLFNIADSVVQGRTLDELNAAYQQVEAQPEFVETYARCRAIADAMVHG